MLKKILIVICSIILVYFAFIFEESIRLKNDTESKPLIILDKVFCDKEDAICYGNDLEYKEEYISLGFNYIQRYALDEQASEDNLSYHIVAEEFWLFNKFLIWGWIS